MVSRRHRRENDLAERDNNSITSSPSLLGNSILDDLLRRYPSPTSVLTLDDRRTFHPDGFFRPAVSSVRGDRSVVERQFGPQFIGHRINNNTKPSRSFYAFGFKVPERVAVCVRRKSRREVLFAKRHTGRGARSRKRFNYWSDVRC